MVHAQGETTMKVYTIKQKMSGTGTIHDMASWHFDRHIKFTGTTQYAVVEAAYYIEAGGSRGYTTHSAKSDACKMSERLSREGTSHTIIDSDGNVYMRDGNTIRRTD
jgi:hypothetical protein